jgi:hypothetical protein
MLKFDAPLAAMVARIGALSDEARVEVSFRMHAPLTSEEAAELRALGLDGADTRRRVVPARISLGALRQLAAKACVHQVSLAQQLRPLAPGERE